MYDERRAASGRVWNRGGVFFLTASLASSSSVFGAAQTSLQRAHSGGYPTPTCSDRPARGESDKNLLFTLAPRSNGRRNNGTGYRVVSQQPTGLLDMPFPTRCGSAPIVEPFRDAS